MAKAPNLVSHTEHTSKGDPHIPVGHLGAELEELPAPLTARGTEKAACPFQGCNQMSMKEWHFRPQQHPFLNLIPRAASPRAVP